MSSSVAFATEDFFVDMCFLPPSHELLGVLSLAITMTENCPSSPEKIEVGRAGEFPGTLTVMLLDCLRGVAVSGKIPLWWTVSDGLAKTLIDRVGFLRISSQIHEGMRQGIMLAADLPSALPDPAWDDPPMILHSQLPKRQAELTA